MQQGKGDGMRRKLDLEELSERVVPSTYNWTGAADQQTWNLAGNWQSADGATFPQAGDTANLNATNNVITTAAAGQTIATLNVNPNFTGVLQLMGHFKVTAGGTLSSNGQITSDWTGPAGGDANFELGGGTFTWKYGQIESSTPILGTLQVDNGAFLTCTEGGFYLGQNLDVKSLGTWQLMNTNNSFVIVRYTQNNNSVLPTLTIESGGTMQVSVDNGNVNGVPNGIVRGDPVNDPWVAIDVQGTLQKSGGNRVAGYGIDEPLWVDGGSINVFDKIMFSGYTGTNFPPTGTRGSSVFVSGSTAEIDLQINSDLVAQQGFLMTAGGLWCRGDTLNETHDTSWNIESPLLAVIRGGTVNVGDSTSIGKLTFSAGLEWDAGTVNLQYLDTSTNKLSEILCNSGGFGLAGQTCALAFPGMPPGGGYCQ
jgi:hypothetical protein